jgi:hypothetical protein
MNAMLEKIGDHILIITAPHFVAGVCMNGEFVATRAAPILKYMVGWDFPKIEEYVAKKKWRWEIGTYPT